MWLVPGTVHKYLDNDTFPVYISFYLQQEVKYQKGFLHLPEVKER